MHSGRIKASAWFYVRNFGSALTFSSMQDPDKSQSRLKPHFSIFHASPKYKVFRELLKETGRTGDDWETLGYLTQEGRKVVVNLCRSQMRSNDEPDRKQCCFTGQSPVMSTEVSLKSKDNWKLSRKMVWFFNINQIDSSLVMYRFLYTAIGDSIYLKGNLWCSYAEGFPFHGPNPGWELSQRCWRVLCCWSPAFPASLSYAQGLISLLNYARFVNSVLKRWEAGFLIALWVMW